MENERIFKAFKAATVSRGKGKGMLKSKCPTMGTDAAIMWQACMMVANPYKVSIFQAILCPDTEFREACTAFANKHTSDLRGLDRDRVALSRLGVW
jgi:hypothetical protein